MSYEMLRIVMSGFAAFEVSLGQSYLNGSLCGLIPFAYSKIQMLGKAKLITETK